MNELFEGMSPEDKSIILGALSVAVNEGMMGDQTMRANEIAAQLEQELYGRDQHLEEA